MLEYRVERASLSPMARPDPRMRSMVKKQQTPGAIMRNLQNSRPDIGDVRVTWVQESQEFVARSFPSGS